MARGLRQVAALGALLLLAGPARADRFATQEELDENRLRLRAWEAYTAAERTGEPRRAVGLYLEALDTWNREGTLDLYEERRERQGVRFRIILENVKTYDYRPSERLFARLAELLSQAERRALERPAPREPRAVLGDFAELKELLERVARVEALASRARGLERQREARIAELTAPPEAPATPDGPGPEMPPGPELPGPVEPAGPSAEELARRAREAAREAARILRLEQEAGLARLQALSQDARAQLVAGEVEAGLAAVSSSSLVLSQLAELTERGAEPRPELAPVISQSLALASQARAMAALEEVLEDGRWRDGVAAFSEGLAAAEALRAEGWSRRAQERAAVALISRSKRGGGVTTRDLRGWREVLEDPLAREALSVEIEAEGLSGADACEAWPVPQGEAGEDPGVVNHYAVAMSVRALSFVEECWQERQGEATPEARHEALRELVELHRGVREALRLAHLSPSSTRALEAARAALERELVALPFCIFSRDADAATRRLAALLAELPALEECLGQRDQARVLVALGLAGRQKMGHDAAFWLVERGLALDAAALDDLPESVPAWLIERARRVR